MALGAETRQPGSVSVLRLLLWLKWKLLCRGYRGNTTAIVGVILLILVFVPASLGLAVLLGAGLLHARPPWNAHILRGLLLAIYLIWLLGPLLGYGLNDTYDITRLFIYPISVRQIFTGAIAGSLIDFSVLMLLPTLVAVVVGFSTSVIAFGLAALALALFLFHTLALSQALVLASAGILRSRRFRDILVVALPLFWMGYYVLSRSLSRRLVRIDWRGFLNGPTWEALNFLPPGLAARSVAAAAAGQYAVAAGYFAALLAVTGATVYVAGWLVQLAFDGAVGASFGRARRAAQGVPAAPPAAPVRRVHEPAAPVAGSRASRVRLPPVVEALAEKELRYFLRDPFFKLTLMNMLYMVFVAGFLFVGGRRATGEYRTVMVWGATGMIMLSQIGLVFNLFGTEGPAAAVLFTFPSSRRQLIMGKNAALFGALSVLNLAVIVVLAAVGSAFEMFGPLFVWMELGLVVFISVGNLASIWFPTRIVMRGARLRQTGLGGASSTRGCAYSLLYMPLMATATMLLLPVLAALVIPVFWAGTGWLLLSIPLAAAYAAGIYLLSLKLAEPLLLQRELAIIERVAATE